MLGQPISMLLPQVIGFKLTGELPRGRDRDRPRADGDRDAARAAASSPSSSSSSAPGIAGLGLADRATIGNMSPEFGSTCAIFPVDAETLRYLEFTGRPTEQIELVDAYTREQGLFHERRLRGADLHATPSSSTSATSCRASPGRSARRTGSPCPTRSPPSWRRCRSGIPRPASSSATTATRRSTSRFPASDPPAEDHDDERRQAAPRGADRRRGRGTRPATRSPSSSRAARRVELDHGHVVIAAITSCTNTSNPSVMLGAGLLAKKAVERGLRRQPWVKTSLAPGSTVVTEYLEKSGLDKYLDKLQFNLVGYGCTTCIGNSGPAAGGDLEGRQREGPGGLLGALGQPQLRGPDQPRHPRQLPRVAAAGGRLRARRPHGHRPDQRADRPRLRRRARLPLATSGPPAPRSSEVDGRRRARRHVHQGLRGRLQRRQALEGDRGPRGRPLHLARLDLRAQALLLRGDGRRAEAPIEPIEGARVLAVLGDSVTTDHISPAGAIKKDSPAGTLADRAGRRAPRLQLLRLPPRQPRGDDPRHLRQRPPAQPPGREGGRLHPPASPTATRPRSTRRRWPTPRRACRWSCSPARSTARAPRATGPRRAPTCSASAP